MMAVQSVCLCGVLLLVTTLWTIGATQKISVGFSDTELEEAEDKQVLRAIINVEVPEGLDFSGFGEDLTVHVTSENGEAIAGKDFEAVDKTIKLTKEDLHVIQTNPDRGDRVVRIPLTKDDYTEGAETFTLSLEADSDVDVVMISSSATVTITDSNKPVEISFDQPTYTAYTSEGTPLKVKVLKTGHIQENITVDVMFSNGILIETIHFEPSQTVIEVSFEPKNDTTISLALAESSRIFEKLVVCRDPADVKVMTFTPEGNRIIKAMEKRLKILEQNFNENITKLRNELHKLQETKEVTVQFNQSDYDVQESKKVRVCLKKNLQTSEDLIVTVTAKESSPPSATGGEDFSTRPQTITIPADKQTAYCEFVDNIITDDSVALEGDETFTLTLTVDDHPEIMITSSATITIIDDDVVTVNFADEVLLPNQNDHKLVRVCLSKSASIKHTLEVPLEWLPADAEANSAKKTSSVTFTEEDTACSNITIKPSELPFELNTGTLPDHVVAGSPSTATVYDVIIRLTQAKYTVNKDEDSVSVCAEALGNFDDFEVDVTSEESSSAGVAGFKIPIKMQKDHKEDCVPIPIKNLTETGVVVLKPSKQTPANVVIVSPKEAKVTIPKPTASEPSSDNANKMVYVWVVVVVIIIIGVAVAAYIIYHQRTKLKDCLAVEEQGGKGRRGRYKKLPANIREALHQD